MDLSLHVYHSILSESDDSKFSSSIIIIIRTQGPRNASRALTYGYSFVLNFVFACCKNGSFYEQAREQSRLMNWPDPGSARSQSLAVG